MLGVARRILRDQGQAEDVVHEAFIAIWRHAHTFDPARGSARTWIYSILRHAALRAARRADRQPGAGADRDDDASALDAVVDAAAQRKLESRPDMGRLHDCLQTLDQPRRDCVLLSYVEGCSHAEIASQLEAPLGTVKSWIRRALTSLRECMA